MKKYVVKTSENIFDISLKLTGSVEGVWNLLLRNPNISVDTILKKGDELLYDEDFIINKDIAKWMEENNVAVKNGHNQINDLSIAQFIYNSVVDYNAKVAQRTASGAYIDKNYSVYENLSTHNTNSSTLLMGFGRGGSAAAVDSSELGKISWRDYEFDLVERVAAKDVTKIDNVLDFKKYNVSWARDASEILKSVDFPETISRFQSMQPFNLDSSDAIMLFEEAILPKIIIKQFGRVSTINVKVSSGGLFVVDWGDNGKYTSQSYSSKVVELQHTYDDDGSHIITIYGVFKVDVLDFMEVNGIYYALCPLAINDQFLTKFENEDEINKLFYIKGHIS